MSNILLNIKTSKAPQVLLCEWSNNPVNRFNWREKLSAKAAAFIEKKQKTKKTLRRKYAVSLDFYLVYGK